MKFTTSEPFAHGLSTRPAAQAYKPAMSQALRSYLDAERGRAARLADELDISRSYISDLASGKKEASLPLLRRIAQATGIPIADLSGAASGLAEGEAAPYKPGTRTNRLRDLVGSLFPGMRHPSYFTATSAHLAFGILAGDLLVTEANFVPEKIEASKLVIADVAQESGDARTVIARLARPWLIDATGHICGEVDSTAAILGVIQIVVRSADPAAY